MQRENNGNQRLAKKIARSGFSSRREAEKYINEGRVEVNGKNIFDLSFKVNANDKIKIDGKEIRKEEKTRLWRFYKPTGVITSHKDEIGRPNIFEVLPKNLPRLITIGRLDFNSEGLLLLTNDGNLKRKLELPSSKIYALTRLEQGVLWMKLNYLALGKASA